MVREDAQLVRKTLLGDDNAFGTLVRKYEKGVHALVWRKIGDFHFAEELTQDTFLHAYKKLATLKNPNQFAGWLYVIANRLCINWVQRKKTDMQSLEHTDTQEIEKFIYTRYVSEQRETENAERRYEIVKQLLEKLPESQRTVVTLYYLGEMTTKEIGNFLGVSVNTVKSRLRRARIRLQQEEQLLISEILGSFQLPASLIENIMRQVADIKPVPPSTGKPFLPWIAFGTATALIALLLSGSNQHLIRFQKPYSFNTAAEATIEIIDTTLVLDIESKPAVRNQIGQAGATGKNGDTDSQISEKDSVYNAPLGFSHFSTSHWELITEIPTKRTNFSTVVVDDKIYLIGGTLFENGRGPFGLSTVEVYDPKTNIWQRGTDMPTPRAGARTAVVNGTIYVFGGYSGIDNRGENFKFLDIVEAYDPQTDTWVRKQDMPFPCSNFGIGVVAGKVYTIGGLADSNKEESNSLKWTDRVEVYDPQTDTWAERAKMPTRRDYFGVGVVNNRIYVIGGRGWPQVGNPSGTFLTVVEEYNPETNQWRKKNDILDLRLYSSTVVVDDQIYLIGGFVWQDGLRRDPATVDVYTPETEEWSDIPPMPTGKTPFGVAIVKGKIYVFGGEGENGEFLPTVEVFNTDFHAVDAIGKLPVCWGELKAQHQN
ncbi:MAG: sigma-70 family RNA polymerase sigma factor [Candidatus Poribacteria bacterium]|nr:sigma-70 family RNA polymerase sigma factor [Candidatus Poribacteria bacterium]